MGKLTAREKVMEAATLLFGEKGYTATTIREVAEKAGVSELTIFRNFKNKENLFRESIILRTTPVALLEEIEEQFTGDLQKGPYESGRNIYSNQFAKAELYLGCVNRIKTK